MLRAGRVDDLRAANQSTVPGTIGEELLTNPFLRADEPALQALAGTPAIRSRPSPRSGIARTYSERKKPMMKLRYAAASPFRAQGHGGGA